MMLTQLKISHFRNFEALHYTPEPRINLIYGPNGAGKTNLLEAIYHLGTGKSFRTTLSSRAIQYGAETCHIHGIIQQKQGFSLTIGIQRHRTQTTNLYVNQQAVSASHLAATLSLRLINPDSFHLLNGGPKHRRQLLNWGVFHVEPLFWETWRQTNRIIKQRNAALKKGQRAQVRTWDTQLDLQAQQLLQMYQAYYHYFEPLFYEVLGLFLPNMPVTLKYYPGWNTQTPLLALLEANYAKDQAFARTHIGPHRADLRIRIKTVPAKDVLSRGQQKLVVCALLLAQGILLKRHLDIQCIYLLDDLASELDEANLKRICQLLEEIDAQVFVTAVDNRLADALFPNKTIKLFHVEQALKIPALAL